MSRKGASTTDSPKRPPWLITYSDLVTLLLAFFVMLMSMSVIDERSKREALGSVSHRFGAGEVFRVNPIAVNSTAMPVEPGPMEDFAENDLEPLRDMIFEDTSKDLQFQENRYVQIFSISDEVLFKPGSAELSDRGTTLLGRLLPYLQRISYPLLVAGHTASRRDEEGGRYVVDLEGKRVDSTWMLSWQRAKAVYRYLTAHGISEGRLSQEAFGQFHPRFSSDTPAGRNKNRRVDLVLDRRNREWMEKVAKLRETSPSIPQEHFFRGFRFDLHMPGATPGERQ